ncbi:MAG: flagellar biosynthesis protein FlhA [Treponema sp.]|jgi:flagellar biosynthesis protein FlhA|nr:flagellar biosynthesis protein FlhA [Treponema sp.]
MADVAKSGNEGGRRSIISLIPLNDSNFLIALCVVVVVAMIIIPLPSWLLDTFIALNLVLSLLVLLIVLYSRKPTEFSLFPWVLFALTVFTLALNVSSTRLILTKGTGFNGAMIRAFSTFVVGSGGTEGLVVGFIIFILIMVVQVAVITKGATRISEVAARFSLDSLPGKQMTIDNEYSTGAITQDESTKRKAELQQESDFFGSMDGASKLISNSVKAGIFIVVLDVIGGIIIGVTIHQEPIELALGTYASLTIGDGLVSQLPALLISTAMGVVVTRAASAGKLGEQISIQFSRYSSAYWIGAVVLFGLAWLPGFPKPVLFPMSLLLGFYAYNLGQKQKKKDFNAELMAKTGEGKRQKEEAQEVSHIEPLDPLSLELGFGLIPLVDKDKGADLMERIQRVRRETALNLGIVIPKIRIIDNMVLGSSEYCLKIRGVEAGKGVIRMGYYLCINPGTVTEEIPGEKTREPVFGLPALWITEDRRDEAERLGYNVVDPPSIIATHFTEVVNHHAAEILDRQITQSILEGMRKDYSAVVDEAYSPLNQQGGQGLSLGSIQKVLQGLLKEQVSIRNMVSILEAVADFSRLSNDTRFITEKARQALGGQICRQYADDERCLHVLTLEPGLEQKIVESKIQNSYGDIVAALEPSLHKGWINAISRVVEAVSKQRYTPVILCSEAARYLIRTALDREFPQVAVLSVLEIAPEYKVESIGVIQIQ